MNGPQDMGGRMGFGAVRPEPEGQLWHADWEPRALALTLACGALGHWTLDESRHARESLPWEVYLGTSYYEIWLRALEVLLERHGEVGADEHAAAQVLRQGRRTERCLRAEAVVPMLEKGGPTSRPEAAPAKFAVGDTVRCRNLQPDGHTRLPGYARGRTGEVVARHGAHVFPDTNAHAQGEAPEWLYTVAFSGAQLWGQDAEPGLTVTIDAWEPYLERT